MQQASGIVRITKNSSRRKAITNRKHRLAKKRLTDPEGFRNQCSKLGIDLDKELFEEELVEDIVEDYPFRMTKNFRSVKPEYLEDDDYDYKPSATAPSSLSSSSFTLCVDKPEANRDGIFAYIVKDVLLEVEKELIDAIVVVLPLADIEDAKTVVSASLLKDGSGLEITQPTAPSFMFDRNSVSNMYIQEDPTVDMSRSMIQGHVVAANAIAINPIRQTKKVTALFPKGMKCRKGPFSETDDNFTLTNYVSVVEGAVFASYQFFNAAVYWKLVVNREEKRATVSKAAPDGVSKIEEACKQIKNHIRKSSPDSSMSVSDYESHEDDAADSVENSSTAVADGAVSNNEHSDSFLFVENPSSIQEYAPLLHEYNVWNQDISDDIIPSYTGSIDPLQGVPMGPHFPAPEPEGTLVDRSREVSEFMVNDERTKRYRLPTTADIMDDENSL